MGATTIFLFILFISLALNIPLSKFKIPPIIGYIVSGIIVASLFDIQKETINHIAELGIIFLMFLIGLEFSPNKLKSMKKEVFLFGILEMGIVSVGFAGLIYYIFHTPINIAIILGNALALSSTAIVLKLLNENREISKPYGRNALGILLFQDIAVIPILIAISLITNKSISLQQMMTQTTIGFFSLLGSLYIVGKYIAPFILAKAVKTKSDEIFLSTVLLIVLSSAWSAHFFGLSYSLGAFLAGMLISETPFKYQIEADLMPFRDLLLAVFFVSVGLSVDINFAISHIGEIILLSFSVMLIKSFMIFLVIRPFNTKRISIKTALTLSQIGEFAFVIFALMGSFGLVDGVLLQKFIVATVLSMVATPFIIKYLYFILDLFDKNKNQELPKLQKVDLKGHIIVVGYDKIGQKVCKKLNKKNIPYIAIDKQIEDVQNGLKNKDNVIFGNAGDKNILEALDVFDAKTAIITTLNEHHTHLITENILSLNPKIKIIVISEDENEVEFYKTNKVVVIDKSREISKKIIDLLDKLGEKNGCD